jgi:hypothetical protein
LGRLSGRSRAGISAGRAGVFAAGVAGMARASRANPAEASRGTSIPSQLLIRPAHLKVVPSASR